jgi:predicted transcriptional regulator
MGRHRVYDYQMIIELAKQGKSDVNIAQECGCSPTTVRKLLRESPHVKRVRDQQLMLEIAGYVRKGKTVDQAMRQFGVGPFVVLRALNA